MGVADRMHACTVWVRGPTLVRPGQAQASLYLVVLPRARSVRGAQRTAREGVAYKDASWGGPWHQPAGLPAALTRWAAQDSHLDRVG
jgi:hypothetical protein